MAKQQPTKTISRQVAKRDQDVVFQEIATLTNARGDAHKVRVIIRSNPYSFQSSGKVERWDGSQWHEVHHLLSMMTPTGLYVHPMFDRNAANATEAARVAPFLSDRDALLDVAASVLF